MYPLEQYWERIQGVLVRFRIEAESRKFARLVYRTVEISSIYQSLGVQWSADIIQIYSFYHQTVKDNRDSVYYRIDRSLPYWEKRRLTYRGKYTFMPWLKLYTCLMSFPLRSMWLSSYTRAFDSFCGKIVGPWLIKGTLSRFYAYLPTPTHPLKICFSIQ